MNNLGTAFVEVKPDMSGFSRSVGRELDGAKSGIKGQMSGFAKSAAAGLAAGAAVGVGLIAKNAITAASDVNESLSKNAKLFGKYAKGVEDFASSSAKSYGISKKAALEYTGVFGNLFRALGQSEKAASGNSVQLTKLAADMASFNNTSVEDALDAIRSGLTGETEPLRKFGVNMNDATLKAQALKMGLIKTTKDALTPQTKAMAAQALIIAQTSQAHGDFKDTSDSLANQQKILKARLDDASAAIGARLLPFAVKGANALNDMLTAAQNGTGVFGTLKGVWDSIAGAFKGGSDTGGQLRTIVQSLVDVSQGLVTIGVAAWERFGGVITDQVMSAVKALGGVLEGLTTALRGLVEFIAGVFTGDWGRAWDGIKAMFEGVWKAITSGLEYQWETIKNVVRLGVAAIGTTIKAAAGGLLELGKWIVNRIVDGLKAYAQLWVDAAGWIKNRLVEGLKSFAAPFIDAGKWVVNRVAEGVKTVTGALGEIGGWIKNRIVEFVQREATGLVAVGTWIVNRLADGLTTVTGALSSVGGWLKNRLLDGVEAVKDGFTGIGGFVIGWIAKGLTGGLTKIRNFVNDIIGVLNKGLGFAGIKIPLIATGSAADAEGYATGGQIRRGTKLTKPVIMMGEEAPRHPEFVVPTNPAYRDRALGLYQQLGNELGVNAYAQGGVIGKLARDVWGETTGLMGSRGAMPPLVFTKLTDRYAHFNPQNGRVAISTDMLAALRDQESDAHNYALSSLVHEFAHARQRGDVINGDRRLTEGGAQLFARWADNRVYDSLGIPFRSPQDAYVSEMAYTRKNKSDRWWKRGQFAPDQPQFADAATAAFPSVGDIAGGVFDVAKGVLNLPAKLLAKGASLILDQLPNPVDMLPDWLQGVGKYAVGRVGGWVKDKVRDLFNNPVTAMTKRMNQIDARGGPYKYSGGHGDGGVNGFDCSGLVSEILRAGGFLGSPITTDGLKVFGEAGDGKLITIGVRGSTGRQAHTMMKLGNRYLESGSGHGAKWVSGWAGNFPIHRHPVGFAKGGILSALGLEHPEDRPEVGWGLAKGGQISAPFVGSYKNGGVVPRDGLAYVHQGETISPQGAPEVRVFIGDRELTDIVRVEYDEQSRRKGAMMRAGVLA